MEISDDIFNEVLQEACRIHKIPQFKPLQRLCMRNLIEGRDLLACLPTGYGKSLIFQAWPTVCSLLEKKLNLKRWPVDGIVLVVCPLLAIMVDQVKLSSGWPLPARTPPMPLPKLNVYIVLCVPG